MGVAEEPDSIRALRDLGRRFREVLDPIVEAFAVPKIKPLEDLDFKIPELPLVMGGRIVGSARLDGEGKMQGEVLDPGAIAALRADLLGGVSIAEECRCEYRHIRGGLSQEILKTVWARHPDCRFDHSGGTIRGRS